MKKIIESVPNFSEGRRKEVVDALAGALTSVPGVVVLDTEMDAVHNRCVISVAGEPESVARGVVESVGKAVETIDLRRHTGEHPRMGAADVIPFIPISGISMAECVELSAKVAQAISTRYGIPTYLYEQSARTPERQDLASVRRGGFETIREEIRTDAGRKPDFGPCEVHPSAGASAVGARFPLIAYNIYLRTPDIEIARAIARSIRFSGGGLRYVKAMGFRFAERDQVQVSMNLTNYEATPIFRVFEMVRREAERYGVSVGSSEIVGLVPQGALDGSAAYYLRLENFSRDQVLENRLAEALPGGSGMEDFLRTVSDTNPLLPAGGSVAAVAGALASALGEMFSGVTEGKKKFAAVETEVRKMHEELTGLRHALERLVEEDSQSFNALLEAYRLPRESGARAAAVEEAARRATETPLRTARAAGRALSLLRALLEVGNPNARCDAGVGAQMAYAALKGAEYNVLANTPLLRDRVFSEGCRREIAELVRAGGAALAEIDALLTRTRTGQ